MTMTREQRLQRIQNIFTNALANNPRKRPVISPAPTVAVSGAGDGALSLYPLNTGNVLQPITNQMNWYGGVPSPVNSLYVCNPVSSVLPSKAGNIGSGYDDKNSWVSGIEFETLAPKVQLGAYCDNVRKIFCYVDDQYVDKAGHTGLGAAADNIFSYDFTTAGLRRFRFIAPTHIGTGPVLWKNLRLTAGYTCWKPDQNEVLKAGFFGDSYGEGVNANNSVTHTANAPFPYVLAELLGIKDMRQFAVGATGFLANGSPSGTRLPAIDQLPNYVSQLPIDLAFVNYGINDATRTGPAVREAATAYLRKLLALVGRIPIFVLGCHAGNGAPSADQIRTEQAIEGAVQDLRYKDAYFIRVSTDSPTWMNSGNASWAVDPTDNLHGTMLGQEMIAGRAAAGARRGIASMLANAW